MTNFVFIMKQHYVPEVYLKRFAFNKSGDVFTLSKSTKSGIKIKSTKKNISGICYANDIYKIADLENVRGYNISDPNFIESNIFKYELKELSQLFDLIERKRIIEKSKARRIFQIIMSIKSRNLAFHKFFNKENMGLMLDIELKNLYDKAPENIPDNFKKEVLDYIESEMKNRQNNDGYNKDLHRYTLISNDINNDNLALVEKMANSKWTIIKSDPNISFIMSDNPGYTFRYRNGRFEFLNLELGYVDYLFFHYRHKIYF